MSRYTNSNNDQRDQRDQRDQNRERYIPRDVHYSREEPVTHPSICIPRTFISIRGKPTKAVVFETLRDLRIGHIERIDVVQKTDARGEKYCTIYIHLQWNMRSELAKDTRQKLLDRSDVKIVYDEPWFWKCSMSTMEKPDRDVTHRAPRPRIDLGDGVKAVSKYTRDAHAGYEHRQEQEQEQEERHDRGQLCNAEINEDSD